MLLTFVKSSMAAFFGSSESDSNPRFLFLNEPRSVHNSVIQIDIEIFTLAQVIDWVIKKKNNSN